MLQVTGIALSYVFVFTIILVATVLQKQLHLSANFSRKLIHIGVGNWIFFVFFYFTDWYIVAIPPITFILINYLSYRYSIFKAMELEEKNPGTIYYAVSLTILTVITFIDKPFKILPYLGILAMTWGDGMAAVIGEKWPVKLLRPGKSLGGTSAFVVFTLAAVVSYLLIHSNFPFDKILIIGGAISITGAVIELFSPRNLDNLFVPLSLGFFGLIFELA